MGCTRLIIRTHDNGCKGLVLTQIMANEPASGHKRASSRWRPARPDKIRARDQDFAPLSRSL